jgi:hypothetical protein
MSLCPVGVASARVALHRSARSRSYKFFLEGADPRSLRGRGVCVVLARCVCCVLARGVCVCAFSFIVFNGRVRVTFVVKR